jgi:hypothetical protein
MEAYAPSKGKAAECNKAKGCAFILDILGMATPEELEDGKNWYSDAYLTAVNLSELSDGRQTPQQVVKVMGLLSVGVSWERTISLTIDMLSMDDCKHPYGRQIEGARRVLSTGYKWEKILGHGPKVDAFVAAILGFEDSVVIDRHAYSILLGRPTTPKERCKLQSKEFYKECADIYRKVASELGMPACQLQAITWLTWRRLYPPNRRVTR